MERILKFLITLFMGLIIFIVLLQLIGWGSIVEAGRLLFGFAGIVILLLTLAIFFAGVLKWRFIFKTQGHIFSFRDLAGLWLAGFSVTYITPVAVVGGEALRIFLTKKKFPSLTLKKNIASVAIDKILDATVFLIFLILGIWIFSFYGWFSNTIMKLIAGSAITVLATGVLFFYFQSLRRRSVIDWFFKLFGFSKHRIVKNGNGKIIFETEEEVFRFFSFKQKYFWQGLGLSFLKYSIFFLRAAVLIFFLKGNIEILKALAVYGFANLAALLPFPATLGGLEATQAVAFGVLGLGFGSGMVFSMVWRAADLFLSLIGIVFLVKYSVGFAEVKISEFIKENKNKKQ